MNQRSIRKLSIWSAALLVIGGIFLGSCEEQETRVDARKHILGKWEEVQNGNWGNMYQTEASGYIEFREDSVVLYFDYASESYTHHAKYWVTDSMLIEMHAGPDGQMQTFRSRYEFVANRLRLDHVDFVHTYTSVLRKVR